MLRKQSLFRSYLSKENHIKMKPEITKFCVEILKAKNSLAETEKRLLNVVQLITLNNQYHLLDGIEILQDQKEIQERYLNIACTNFSELLKLK